MTTPAPGETLSTLAADAFVYTFPLFEMLRLRAATAPRRNAQGRFADDTRDGTRRWLNTFAHSPQLLKAGESRVVTPNYDTLYSSAWLDLRQGPLVLHAPDTADRYYVLGLLDAYTNPFAHLGRRTTGTRAQAFWLSGPDWAGTVPPGMHPVRCPTPMVWIIGRLLVDGEDDQPQAAALQAGFTLTTPHGEDTTGIATDVGRVPRGLPDDAQTYFARVAEGLRENPPPAADAAFVARLAPLGLGSHASPPQAAHAWSAAHRDAVQAGYLRAREVLAQRARRLRRQPREEDTSDTTSRWVMPALLTESFGTDYRTRARIALGYIGALCSAEAVYPMAYEDATGEPLSGAHRYRLRYAPGTLPPVDAFWSLTMYRTADFMLVANALDRYAIGDRSQHLRWDDDGGLALAIQHEPPSDTANWLPAPADGFYLCLRAYQPRAAWFDGSYRLPAIERLGPA